MMLASLADYVQLRIRVPGDGIAKKQSALGGRKRLSAFGFRLKKTAIGYRRSAKAKRATSY
jgi:hypothetical protein